MSIYSAKNARISIDASAFKAKKWDVDAKADEHDMTTFESGGYAEWLDGVKEISGTIELDVDITAGVTSYDLAPIGSVKALRLYVNSAAAPAALSGSYWDIPTAVIFGNTGQAGVRAGAVGGTIKFKGTGTFTPPT